METERLRMARLAERIPTLFTVVRTREKARLERLSQTLVTAVARRLEKGRQQLSTFNIQLSAAATLRLNREQHRLALLTQRSQALDPALLLKRGYSITLCNGKALRSTADLQPGDDIETRLEQGTIYSTVHSTQQNNK